jgi:hypothetical protein
MSQCSSQIGTFSLLILDESGREVNTSGCSVEVELDGMDLEKELRSPSSGIMLKSAEIYRVEANFKLPSKKGVYRLKAQAIPAAITSEQSEKLIQKGLRVLQGNCAAPVAIVEIR